MLLLVDIIAPKFEDDAILYPPLNEILMHLAHFTSQLKCCTVAHTNAGMIETGIHLFWVRV